MIYPHDLWGKRFRGCLSQESCSCERGNLSIKSGKLGDCKICTQTAAPNPRSDAFEASNNTIHGPDIDDQPHAHPNDMRQQFDLSLPQLAPEIVQHGASMAAYNTR
jgi:hypothetical protein